MSVCRYFVVLPPQVRDAVKLPCDLPAGHDELHHAVGPDDVHRTWPSDGPAHDAAVGKNWPRPQEVSQ